MKSRKPEIQKARKPEGVFTSFTDAFGYCQFSIPWELIYAE
jgi:hypothetical protein